MSKRLKITKDTLEHLYWAENLTQKEIAIRLDCAQSSIFNHMKRLGIPRRLKYVKTPLVQKVTLETLYVTNKLTLLQIASKFDVHVTTIWKWLKKYKIPRRSLSEALKGRKPPFKHRILAKNVLNRLYWEDNLTSRQIAEFFHISQNTILQQMKFHNIKIKKRSEQITPETRKKMSASAEGRSPWNKGKIYLKMRQHYQDPVFKEKMRKAISVPKSMEMRQKLSKTLKKLWKDPDFAKKKFASLQISPNKPELRLIHLITKNNLPLKYTGDGKYFISGLCPDFVGTKNPKKVVEVFGTYWHDPSKRDLKPYQTESGRKAIFAKHGFSTLIIWEDDISNPELVNKISHFLRC